MATSLQIITIFLIDCRRLYESHKDIQHMEMFCKELNNEKINQAVQEIKEEMENRYNNALWCLLMTLAEEDKKIFGERLSDFAYDEEFRNSVMQTYLEKKSENYVKDFADSLEEQTPPPKEEVLKSPTTEEPKKGLDKCLSDYWFYYNLTFLSALISKLSTMWNSREQLRIIGEELANEGEKIVDEIIRLVDSERFKNDVDYRNEVLIRFGSSDSPDSFYECLEEVE